MGHLSPRSPSVVPRGGSITPVRGKGGGERAAGAPANWISVRAMAPMLVGVPTASVAALPLSRSPLTGSIVERHSSGPAVRTRGQDMRSILAAVLFLAVTSAAQSASCGSHESVLRDIKLKEWPAYYRTGNAEGLRGFLLDGFRVIGADGSVSMKEEEVAWVARGLWNPKDFVYTITSISCPGTSTAIIVGEGRFKGEVDGVWHEHRYVSSNVLLLDNGRWRPAISHISGERSERVAG